jgi:hypothetical protein
MTLFKLDLGRYLRVRFIEKGKGILA